MRVGPPPIVYDNAEPLSRWCNEFYEALIWYGIGDRKNTEYLSQHDTLSSAIDNLGTSDQVVLVIERNETLTGAVTIPANIKLKPIPGNVITTGGNALTIKGPIEAGRWQIFSGSGVVSHSGRSGQQYVYPEWWGENTTPGTTDMTAEIQAAIDFAEAGSDGYGNSLSVDLAPTIYLLSSPGLNITTTGVSIGCSSGSKATLLRNSGSNWKTLHISSGTSSYIAHNKVSNLNFIQTNVPSSSDVHLSLEGCQLYHVKDLYIKDSFKSIVIKGCLRGTMEGVNAEATNLLGAYQSEAGHFEATYSALVPYQNANLRVSDCDFNGTAATRAEYHYGYVARIRAFDGLWFDNCHFHKSGNIGIYFVPVTSPIQTSILSIKFDHCYIDKVGKGSGYGTGVLFSGTSSGGLQVIKFISCEILNADASGTTENGVTFATGSSYSDVIFEGNTIAFWGKHGFQQGDTDNTNIILANNTIYSNGLKEPVTPTYDGVNIITGAKEININSNTIGSSVSGSGIQRYGIYGGDLTDSIITGNLIKYNDTDTITWAGGSSRTRCTVDNNEDT